GASRAGNSATVASPGPAPKTIIAPSSGWLAIRPRWIVHRCYSGPWRPRRGRHPLRSRSPARAFRDVAPGPGGCGGARVRRPLPVLRWRHQEAFRRLVDHRHLPFAKRFIAMLHASGAASTLQRRGIPHTRPSCGCASVPPDPFSTFSELLAVPLSRNGFMMGPEFARGYQRSMGKRANENPPRAWAAAPGAAVRPETTSGGT